MVSLLRLLFVRGIQKSRGESPRGRNFSRKPHLQQDYESRDRHAQILDNPRDRHGWRSTCVLVFAGLSQCGDGVVAFVLSSSSRLDSLCARTSLPADATLPYSIDAFPRTTKPFPAPNRRLKPHVTKSWPCSRSRSDPCGSTSNRVWVCGQCRVPFWKTKTQTNNNLPDVARWFTLLTIIRVRCPSAAAARFQVTRCVISIGKIVLPTTSSSNFGPRNKPELSATTCMLCKSSRADDEEVHPQLHLLDCYCASYRFFRYIFIVEPASAIHRLFKGALLVPGPLSHGETTRFATVSYTYYVVYHGIDTSGLVMNAYNAVYRMSKVGNPSLSDPHEVWNG